MRASNTRAEIAMLAGRSMGWIVVGISQLASLLSAVSYLGNPGEAYGHDLKYLAFSVCGYLVLPVVIYLFLNFFYRLEIVSIYEYLERRFNYPTRLLASAIFIAARLAWMATIVSAVSVAVEKLTGLEPWLCIVAITVISAAYTLVGGMKAIIWTDVIQFILFTGGLLGALLAIGWKNDPGALIDVVVRDDKLRLLDFSLDPTVRMTFWMAITAGLVNAVANMTDQVTMQRYLSCKTLREARKAVWIKPVLSLPIVLLLYAVGLALYGHYQLNPAMGEGIASPDQAFPHFILHEMPAGLAGIMIAAIFAAAMSSIDSGIHTLSTVCIEDYYKRLLRPDASDRHCLNLARWLTLFWACVIVCIALVFAGKDSIVGMMASVAAPFFGCMVGIFILGTTTRRASAWGTFCGALIGYGLVLWVKFTLHQVDGQWHLLPTGIDSQDDGSYRVVSRFWYPLVSFLGTVIAGYLISLVWRSRQDLRGLNIWDQAQ